MRIFRKINTMLDLRKAPSSQSQIISADSSLSTLDVATATPTSAKSLLARVYLPLERGILRKSSNGDTIVEVLIAIAVVSLVLAGAFTSTRNSANKTRTAQEQGEALKLAEAQVEQIKIAADRKSPDVFSIGNFCLVSGVITPSCTTGGIPYTTITQHDVINPNDFVVNVTWPGLSGNTNNVEMSYRIIQ